MSDGFQYEIDFRTKCSTAITSEKITADTRSACDSLNRSRARGLLEASTHAPPGEPLALDVWSTAFGERAREWEVPLIDLESLGLRIDNDGFISSTELIELPSGAEAQPYLDRENLVVYKLFDLKRNGAVGKKLVFRPRHQGFEVDFDLATWVDTIEKFAILNRCGAHPTEFVGLAQSGEFMIAKQPLAHPFEDFYPDRKLAELQIRAVTPIGGDLREHIVVSMVEENEYWLIGDLHKRNIMRDSLGRPTIIDALLARVTPFALQEFSWLRKACADAKVFRETGQLPVNEFENVNDEDL